MIIVPSWKIFAILCKIKFYLIIIKFCVQNPKSIGILPSSVRSIFNKINNRNCFYKVEISIVEISDKQSEFFK